MSWPTDRTEFGPNRTPVLIGIAYQDEKTIVPLAVDETTGALLTTSSGGGGDVTITGPLGQMPMADSVSVAIASDQSNIPVAIESGNITGFATSANQTNGNQETQIVQGGNTASVDTNKNLNVQNELAPRNTVLNTFENQYNGNGTVTVSSASVAYISSIAFTVVTAGTTSKMTIEDNNGLYIVDAVTTTSLSIAPTIYNFQTPIKMTGGIYIIFAGGSAAVVNLWVNYYA